MPQFRAKNDALQELVKLLMPNILQELEMNDTGQEVKEVMQEKPMDIPMPEMGLEDELMQEDDDKKPKGIKLSLAELGILGSKPENKPIEKKKRNRGKPARRIK